MRLRKIQYSRVTAALLVFLSGAALMAPSQVVAQCTGTVMSTSYDTTFSNSTSNVTGLPISGAYSYNLPRFPVSSSTLLAVVVTSTITVSASMTVQDETVNPLPAPFAQIFRTDGFNSNYISKSSSVVSNPVFGGPLNPGQSETLDFPDIISSQQVLYDSVLPVNPNFPHFTGVGGIGFTYASNNIPLPSSQLTVTSYTLTEQIVYNTTYYYCVPFSTLATDILNFTAVRENSHDALLSWTASNELPGRNYVIQVSKDGTNFVDSATVPAQVVSGDASYTYNFPLDPSATGNIYFRIKIEDVSAPLSYSQICIIRLGDANATGFSIYPNPPTDFINLSFPGGNQNWDVAIYAADGNIVQHNSYPTTNLARVNFNRKMAAGTYFVRAINPQTNQSYSRSFVVNTP
jgi:hypothetical protein